MTKTIEVPPKHFDNKKLFFFIPLLSDTKVEQKIKNSFFVLRPSGYRNCHWQFLHHLSSALAPASRVNVRPTAHSIFFENR
ncbi:MAG: hypothetical protein IJQ89_06860 [Bacteroidales bacterium]|nr:hypothetical protein [Bacteroidales bacterium]